jgi:hypothetical protein
MLKISSIVDIPVVKYAFHVVVTKSDNQYADGNYQTEVYQTDIAA